ncbi:MAG: hypothetical protein KY438_06160 [Actinobacteria bacterium]|nr:hypothetical protein [Actinomycetota bacterium]
MASLREKLTAGAVVAVLAFGAVACQDEDGDGATTDEEIDGAEEKVDEGADQLEEEVDESNE